MFIYFAMYVVDEQSIFLKSKLLCSYPGKKNIYACHAMKESYS